jgi:hypothetical protein
VSAQSAARRGEGRCPGCGLPFVRPGAGHGLSIRRSALPSEAGRTVTDVAAPTIGFIHGSMRGGEPLPPTVRRSLEQAYNTRLAGVRVHASEAAGQAAAALHAKAFSLGSTIWFGQGRYRPDTRAGRRLLAHEVAHTIQQSGRGPEPGTPLEVGAPGDPVELAAGRAAEAVAAGRPVPGVGQGPDAPRIQRDPLDEEEEREAEPAPESPPPEATTEEPPRVPHPREVSYCTLMPELCRPAVGPRLPTHLPTAEDILRPVPPPARTTDGLRSFFERDPLLRLLPPGLRSRAIDGLMRADEAIAGAIVGQLDFDATTRRAITETLRALLRYMKGERWTPPPAPPPSRLPPDFGSHRFPRAPGERIFMLPPIRF